MRVMLVEDEKAIANDIAEGLGEAGYVVDVVHDGEEAWFRGETEDYDAIVIDLGLPKLDGLSVVRRLRAAKVTTPVLVLTARGAWMERVEGIDAGADDYLVKPFHMEEVIARLGAVLRRSGGHASPQLEAGGMIIDTRGMTATIGGRSIILSALEYRLLRYLAHHAGRIVPQTELSEHVYGGDREPDSNALEVLIARLRRKIGSDVIGTRRGHGYFMTPAGGVAPVAQSG
jgi:two-component system OmpR family response regulator